MKQLILVILTLTLIYPSTGKAQSDTIPIAPCLPANAAIIRLSGEVEFGGEWLHAVKDKSAFYALMGTQIKWLGYARKGEESKEWYGVEAGFGGINMFNYGDAFLITIHDSRRVIIGRIEVHEYLGDYLLFFTTLAPFGLADGSRYDYHIPADPRGGDCMFKISADEFNEVSGWQ